MTLQTQMIQLKIWRTTTDGRTLTALDGKPTVLWDRTSDLKADCCTFRPWRPVVNPPDVKYCVNKFRVRIDAVRRVWESLQEASHQYCDESLHRETLGDDYQQLFVDIIMTHVRELTGYIQNLNTLPVKPLRLLLLGTAGTGKTTTVQTALQEMLRHLTSLSVPFDFVRVAAPTGCAAFNMHFNATTIHRLIHHFRLGTFSQLQDKSLARLQEALKETRILFLDEFSMIGRQFMGRIDSRLNQAKAGSNPTDSSLGGVSCVCSGDPAQCEAISDQQMYDTNAHKDTASAGEAQRVQLSNAGMSVYEEFDEVVVLSKIHRLTQLSEATTDEQRLYNARCVRFAEIQLRMRDMTLTSDDYFWLCKLKRSARSSKDRLFFKDAVTLMEFRRTTENNEEDNCEFYNRQHLRAQAKHAKVPVIAFDAVHEGTPQENGMTMKDELFNALPRRLELAVGAPVLLLHNLAVEHGLMNGSQGTVMDIVFAAGDHPNHDLVANRMPIAIIVNFPGYCGPLFFAEQDRRTWVILQPKEQESGERSEVTTETVSFVSCIRYHAVEGSRHDAG